MTNLNTAVQKLGTAAQDKGVNLTKVTLLSQAQTSLSLACAAALTMGTVTETPSESGGTLGAATYKYKVSAVSGNGEGVASAATDDSVISGSSGKVVLTWTAVPNAVAYRVYGRTGGQYRRIAEVTTNTYTDDGSVATPDAGHTAPSSDASALSVAARGLALTALTHVAYAIDMAKNDTSGSGRPVELAGVNEKKLNEPFHTQQALNNAAAASNTP